MRSGRQCIWRRQEHISNLKDALRKRRRQAKPKILKLTNQISKEHPDPRDSEIVRFARMVSTVSSTN
jgi:hypothetical protein